MAFIYRAGGHGKVTIDEDIPDNVTAVRVPAKIIKQHEYNRPLP